MKVLCIKSITLTNGEIIISIEKGKIYRFNEPYAQDLIKEGYAKFLFDIPEQEAIV